MDKEGRVRVNWKPVKKKAYKVQNNEVSEPSSRKDFEGNVVSEANLEIANLESGKRSGGG